MIVRFWVQGRQLWRRQLTGPIAMQSTQPVLPHQSLDAVLAACLPEFAQVLVDAWGAVDAVTRNERGANQTKQSCIFLGSIGNWPFQPCVVPGASNTQKATHHDDAKLVSMQLDELVRFPRLALRSSWHGHFLAPMREC